MSAVVLAALLAAAGVEDYEGAATGDVRAASERGAGEFGAGLSLRGNLRVGSGSLFTEVRLSLYLETPSNTFFGAPFQDLGSSIALGYRPHGFFDELRLTLWPVSSITAVPAFDWTNKMGVMSRFSPAVSFQASSRLLTFWSTVRFKPDVHEGRLTANPDVILGASVRLPEHVQVESRFAWFRTWDTKYAPPYFCCDVVMGSGRVSWTLNEYVGPALDLFRYSSDPFRFERFFAPEPRASKAGLWLGLEGGGGQQEVLLGSFYGASEVQPFAWLDAQARLRIGDVRVFATGRVQTASLLRGDEENSGVGSSLAPRMTSMPALTAIVGADITWHAAKLTPGVLLNVERPAWFQHGPYTSELVNLNESYIILDGGHGFSVLPYNAKVKPRAGVKFSLKWEPSPILSVAAEVNLVMDWNASQPMFPQPAYTTSLSVRGQLMVQTRF